jgi:uncharacterized protein YdeI (YjbR/CyaY-like superfamily)
LQVGEKLEANSLAVWKQWLLHNHAHRREIWFVFFKKSTGKQKVAYDTAVDEALCFGWIDGQMKSLDSERYALRFSPRKSRGKWSETNRASVRRLVQEGRMTEAGLAVLPADISL